MATDSIVGGLFGMTPQSYQAGQQALADREAMQFAELNPYQQATFGAYSAGRQLGRGLGGLLGVEDTQLKKITAFEQAAKNIDYSDPESIMLGARSLAQIDPASANALANMALNAEFKQSQITKNLREGRAASVGPEGMRAQREAQLLGAIRQLKVAEQSPEVVNALQSYTDELAALQRGGKAEKAPPSMVAEYQFAKTADGGGFKGTFQEFVTARALASRPPGQPRPEQPPVSVVDPTTGKVVLVSREEAIANRLTPATSMESISPKEIQNREAKYPQAKAAVTTFQSNAEKLAKDLETLADSKGLEGITGLIGGRTPAITKEARAAEALYNSIVARGGFNELQNMRNASPTGGALGNVSNQEGQQLRDSFAALKLTQNASDLKSALRRAAEDTRASAGRIKDTFDLTYEYKTQRGQASAAPSSPKTPMSADDLVNKYLNQ